MPSFIPIFPLHDFSASRLEVKKKLGRRLGAHHDLHVFFSAKLNSSYIALQMPTPLLWSISDNWSGCDRICSVISNQ